MHVVMLSLNTFDKTRSKEKRRKGSFTFKSYWLRKIGADPVSSNKAFSPLLHEDPNLTKTAVSLCEFDVTRYVLNKFSVFKKPEKSLSRFIRKTIVLQTTQLYIINTPSVSTILHFNEVSENEGHCKVTIV